jgi:hypothetical protein
LLMSVIEFPHDDDLERVVHHKLTVIQSHQARVNAESQALQLLSRAADFGLRAHKQMMEAVGYSSWDVMGGGVAADMMERNALTQAGSLAGQADMLVQQAQSFSPSVKRVEGLEVPEMSAIAPPVQ